MTLICDQAGLRRKLEAKERRQHGGAGVAAAVTEEEGGAAEIARLEAQLACPEGVSAATAHGVKKRLAVLRAAELRAQRQEEGRRRAQVRRHLTPGGGGEGADWRRGWCRHAGAAAGGAARGGGRGGAPTPPPERD
eukprot:SAG25_NODE_189_length_12334_cov_8.994279_3_plen_136_part_00